jgi:hypothetical protein
MKSDVVKPSDGTELPIPKAAAPAASCTHLGNRSSAEYCRSATLTSMRGEREGINCAYTKHPRYSRVPQIQVFPYEWAVQFGPSGFPQVQSQQVHR